MHGSVVMPSMPLRVKNISSHFEHRGRFNEHRAIILTGARQSLHAPERAETEGSFLPADSVISLANIIAIYEVLQANGINTTVSSEYINGRHIGCQTATFRGLQDLLQCIHEPILGL